MKKTESGKWQARPNYGSRLVVDETGNAGLQRNQRGSKTFRTKKEADAYIAREESGIIVAASNLRLGEYLTGHWLPFYRQYYKISSYVKRETDVRVHIIPALGAMKLDKLTTALVQRFYDDLGKRLQPNTVTAVAATLSAALNCAVRWEMLPRNPCQNAQKPALTRRKPTIWTPAQLQAFLATEDDSRWTCLWMLLAVTGMRKGEVLALTWDDVDLDAGVLRVERTISKAEKGFVIGPVKTHAGERVVSLPSVLVQMLKELRPDDTILHASARKPSDKRLLIREKPIAVGVQHSEEHRIGLDSLKQRLFPLTPIMVDNRWKRLIREAKLPYVRIHDLRHGNATVALEAGVPLKVISERLGHASIGVTASVYAHVTRTLDQRAADTIGGVLLGHAKPPVQICADNGHLTE